MQIGGPLDWAGRIPPSHKLVAPPGPPGLPDCPPGSQRFGDDPICHVTDNIDSHDPGYSYDPEEFPPTTPAEREQYKNENHIIYEDTRQSAATRGQLTPLQINRIEDQVLQSAVDACPYGCHIRDGKILSQNYPPDWKENDPIPPKHEDLLTDFGSLAGYYDQKNRESLFLQRGGVPPTGSDDIGASHQSWLGPKATDKGIMAHYARMISGTPRPPSQDEKGDHGEPSLNEEAMRDLMDSFPGVGVASRLEQTIEETTQGNPHANQALLAMYTTGAGDLLIPLGLGYSAKLLAAGYRGVQRTSMGAKLIWKGEQAFYKVTKPINRLKQVAGMASIKAAANKLAKEDLKRFEMKEAKNNVDEVVNVVDHGHHETVKRLTLSARQARAAGANYVKSIPLRYGENKLFEAGLDAVMGEKPANDEPLDDEPSEDEDTEPTEDYGTTSDRPYPPGTGERESPRTGHEPHDDTDTHNTVAQHKERLAEREQPPALPLFAGPPEPMHPHQVDASNALLLGGLTLGGILIAMRA